MIKYCPNCGSKLIYLREDFDLPVYKCKMCDKHFEIYEAEDIE